MGDAPDFLAMTAYRNGVTPLDYALQVSATHIFMHHETELARAEAPGAYPITPLDADQHYWARRLIAALLDAGWSPPEDDGNT